MHVTLISLLACMFEHQHYNKTMPFTPLKSWLQWLNCKVYLSKWLEEIFLIHFGPFYQLGYLIWLGVVHLLIILDIAIQTWTTQCLCSSNAHSNVTKFSCSNCLCGSRYMVMWLILVIPLTTWHSTYYKC